MENQDHGKRKFNSITFWIHHSFKKQTFADRNSSHLWHVWLFVNFADLTLSPFKSFAECRLVWIDWNECKKSCLVRFRCTFLAPLIMEIELSVRSSSKQQIKSTLSSLLIFIFDLKGSLIILISSVMLRLFEKNACLHFSQFFCNSGRRRIFAKVSNSHQLLLPLLVGHTNSKRGLTLSLASTATKLFF